jgi:ABC-type multidrug transport system fused ATPase/permease subunit
MEQVPQFVLLLIRYVTWNFQIDSLNFFWLLLASQVIRTTIFQLLARSFRAISLHALVPINQIKIVTLIGLLSVISQDVILVSHTVEGI